jgi:hypothetical protein
MNEELSHDPFIPSELDDAGLPANQFRVLCHLWRRGETFSNAATIAKVCRLKRDTVFQVLNDLEKVGFIHRKSRPGQTTVIEPVPFGGTGKNGNPSRLGGREVSRSGGRDPSRLGGHKGNTTKAIPLRQSQGALFPDLPFHSDSFKAAWTDWQQHRREKRKPLTPTSVKSQFKELVAWGEDRAIAAINHSIKKGWEGIFEPSANGTKPAGTVNTGRRTATIEEV